MTIRLSCEDRWTAVLGLPLIAYSLAAEIVRGTVVSVHDGDGLTLLTSDNRRIKIRLYGIDAPELKQPFGREAREALVALVDDHRVIADIKSHDRYGRSVAMVTVGSTNVNEQQIAIGMSWWYCVYARREVRLRNLERLARQARIGLWSDLEPIPPWVARATTRHRSTKQRRRATWRSFNAYR